MKPKRGEIVKVQIDDLAFGGKGVARLDGFVLLVEEGLPGDIAEARVFRVKSNYAEAAVVNLIAPSPHRVSPACRHFDYCGGCKWQNLDYAIQKKYKEDQVREALVHVGGIPEPPVEPIVGARKIYYYRNKMEFSFHVGKDKETLLGLHVARRFQDVFQLKACHLQSELSNQIVNFVRERSDELELPPYDIFTHEGFLRFLVIREGKFTDETLVNIVTGAGDFPKIKQLAEEIGHKFPSVVSVSHTVNARKANIARGEKEIVLYGADSIHEKLGEKKYRISASSFFQTNSYQVQRLYDLALELAEPHKLDKMIDLYTGTGTIAIYFANRVKEVVGVENVEDSVADARANAKINSVVNCRFVVADVETYLRTAAAEGESYDLMLLDPPRAGCHPKAIKSIIEMKPKKLIYISCNPATLARDIKMLVEGGYQLDKVVPIDMFPHTYHIEAVCRLTLNPADQQI